MGETDGPPVPERIAQRVFDHEVTIVLAHDARPKLEPRGDARRPANGDLGRQVSRQSQRPTLWLDGALGLEGRQLPARVNPSVGATGSSHFAYRGIHGLNRTEQLAGHRASFRLRCETRKGAAVVRDRQ